MHPPSDPHDPVVGRFPGSLPNYWYIISCVANIPLIACLATWYIIWATDKTPIVAPLFQIGMPIFVGHGYVPNPPLVRIVWVLTRGHMYELCVDSNGFYSHLYLLGLNFTLVLSGPAGLNWHKSGLNCVLYLVNFSPVQSSWHCSEPFRAFGDGVIPNCSCKVIELQRQWCRKSTNIQIFSRLLWSFS